MQKKKNAKKKKINAKIRGMERLSATAMKIET